MIYFVFELKKHYVYSRNILLFNLGIYCATKIYETQSDTEILVHRDKKSMEKEYFLFFRLIRRGYCLLSLPNNRSIWPASAVDITCLCSAGPKMMPTEPSRNASQVKISEKKGMTNERDGYYALVIIQRRMKYL